LAVKQQQLKVYHWQILPCQYGIYWQVLPCSISDLEKKEEYSVWALLQIEFEFRNKYTKLE